MDTANKEVWLKKCSEKLDWAYSQPSIICKYIYLLLQIIFIGVSFDR